MKLQIDSIDIKDMCIGPKTYVSDHILHINLQELEEIILRDRRIESVELDLVNPGDRVRIVNVVDVVQPRCKIDQEDADFPGWIGKLRIAGEGKTRALRGVCIVLSNRCSKRPYSSIIDMFGMGAEIGRYGRMKNICIDPISSENIDERDFESAVKLAGLKTAVYLAKAAEGHAIDQSEVFELNIPSIIHGEKSNLPRVVYYYQLHTPQHNYQGKPDPILYGADVDTLMPTLVHPNEILDGAIVSPQTVRCIDTYSIQNHAVIKELYKRHEKELIFGGVIVGVASMEPDQRQRMAMMVANIIANGLGADGVVLTKVFGGMPHADVALTAEACESLGIKTALFIMLWHSIGSIADEVFFNSDSLDAIINVGQICERFILSEADKIIGGTADTRISNPDFVQKADDKSIDIEAFLHAGVIGMLGDTNTVAVEY
jgi:glycine reductase